MLRVALVVRQQTNLGRERDKVPGKVQGKIRGARKGTTGDSRRSL